MGRWGVLPVIALLVYSVAAYLPINDCGDPPPVANSYRTFPDNNTVEYRCMDTYILSAGDLVRKCINGIYNGTSPVCTLDCGHPLNSSYASINSTGTLEGDKVTYTCPDGYHVSSTESKCSATYGYWLVGDRCFANRTLDVTPFTASQTSTATLADIMNTSASLSSLSPNTTFNASNAVNQTNMGLSLLSSGCSSTKREQHPSLTVHLDDYYTIYQVAVTLPNDDFASSIPNLEIRSLQAHSSSGNLCKKHKHTIPAGSRFVAVCSSNRYPAPGKILRFEVDFGNNHGMLQICQIEVYARPLTSVDCGQPPPVPFAMIATPPSSTFYIFAEVAVTYQCMEGYTMKSGKGTGHCNSRGFWVVSITCTDDENLSQRKPVYLLNNDTTDVSQLTDGNTSSCAVNLHVSETTLVIDLGTDTEVRDVTFYDVEYLKDSYVDVSVRRDGYPESSCGRHQANAGNRMTINVACASAPVGRYVSVQININPIQICEIMVHGRAYTDVLECFKGKSSYKGFMNVTVAGIPCQRWDSQSPHAHSQTDVSKFPDDNLADAANYCRNPDGKYGLWCYTIDPDVEWQYCPIRSCNLVCLLDEEGSTYKGYRGITSSGAGCVKWNKGDIPFKKTSYFSDSMKHALCRNPAISQSRPWCYTSTDASQYGLCDIPSCPTAANLTRGHWIPHAHETLDDILPSATCLVWNKVYSAGTFSGTTEKAFKPKAYGGSSMVPDACLDGKVFNTTFLCYNITESGTVWKGGVLECVHCGSPPSIGHATVSISSSLQNGTATYACVTGYRHASGSNIATCLKTGEWEVVDMECRVDCGVPPSIDHAYVNANSTLVGDTADYFCKDGFKLQSGSDQATCLDTGQWEIIDMKCVVNCGDPPSINRTEVSPADGFVNETVEYTCKPGYAHVSGSAVITCLDTGTWEEPGIYCEVNCGNPPTINRADSLPTDGFVNETAEYTCKPGYEHVSGSAVITCQETGAWEEAGIYCEVDCSSPPIVANTFVMTDNTTLNSIAVYRCTPGFVHARGSTNITCLGAGIWETPSIQCVDTPLPLTTASPTTPAAPVNKFGRTIYEKCTCRCINKQKVDQEDMVQKITKELILDVKSLKSYTRTKESLPDGRKSSKGVAYIALSVIGVLFGVVFLSDIYYLINGIMGCFGVRQ